uniref:Small monomeric GTPase n=1 Tax=Ciona savignyi TaxID=51511 RepID=H2YLQ2_CIOSA
MVVLRGKCVVVGDPTVGKTAIAQAYHSDGSAFPKSYSMSTGIDLLQKFVQLGDDNKEVVDLFVFDSAGRGIFKDLNEASYNKVGMFVIVFDLSSSKSFSNCQKWLEELKNFFEPGKNIPGILIGNKCDLKERRQVDGNKANAFAVKHNLLYFECSAKHYEGIDGAFKELANRYHTLHQENPESIQQIE